MFRILFATTFLFVAAALLFMSERDAQGCASLPPLNGPSIRIAEESAIIVWDPVKKVQHFIRRAAFDTKAPDFGFLVPTPTMPKLPLETVEDGIFSAMDKWMLPKTVEQTKWKFDPMMCMFGCGMKVGSKADMMEKAAVRVLHEQKVGGYEVNVLEADNAEELSQWIKKHGYSADPELYAWLTPYVANKWKITAFKISQDPTTGQLATTKAVRMSFQTERPFFPYREPERKEERNAIDPGRADPKTRHEPTEIDGIWRVVSAEGDGKEAGDLQDTKFWFVGGIAVGRFLKDTKYTVDASKEPKWLDVGTMRGIYKLDGDTLYWWRGKIARPSGFDTKEGVRLVLRRDKKAEADDKTAQVDAREWQRIHGGDRLLRVLFVSDSRMDAKLGTAAWHAKIPWSNELTDEQRQQIAKETGVPADEIPVKAWLTAFEDRSSPRPGKDEVYFDPAKDQTPIVPPPFIKYHEVWIPPDCVLAVGIFVTLGAISIAARMMRKKAA